MRSISASSSGKSFNKSLIRFIAPLCWSVGLSLCAPDLLGRLPLKASSNPDNNCKSRFNSLRIAFTLSAEGYFALPYFETASLTSRFVNSFFCSSDNVSYTLSTNHSKLAVCSASVIFSFALFMFPLSNPSFTILFTSTSDKTSLPSLPIFGCGISSGSFLFIASNASLISCSEYPLKSSLNSL